MYTLSIGAKRLSQQNYLEGVELKDVMSSSGKFIGRASTSTSESAVVAVPRASDFDSAGRLPATRLTDHPALAAGTRDSMSTRMSGTVVTGRNPMFGQKFIYTILLMNFIVTRYYYVNYISG